MTTDEDQLSRHIYDLCSLLFTILGTPHLAVPPASSPLPRRARPTRRPMQLSPAGLASLLLGASLALMLCGSVTFFIGFILMPWVIALVMFFYFVSLISTLSALGWAILSPDASTGRASHKDMSGPTLFESSDYLDKKWQLN